MNLHLFLRAESRRRGSNATLELPVASLGLEEQSVWKASLDAYEGMAKRSLITDDDLVRLTNALAEKHDESALSSGVEPQIARTLSEAAPIYRTHLWAEHRRQDTEWIGAHCSDIQLFDRTVKKKIARDLRATASKEPILVDLAREVGPTLAYTTDGTAGTPGHTVIAPQKNTDPELALNTVFHELSHTMDSQLRDAIDREAARQRVKPPEDLWHAVTLYTTCEITKRVLAKDHRPTASLDSDRMKMFERNGWNDLLVALEKYWQPYLDRKASFQSALAALVRDTSR